MKRRVQVSAERWPLRHAFRIARGSKTEAAVLVVELHHNGARGRGECVPYARYGETLASVAAQIDALRPELEQGLGRDALQQRLPAGAARNALDCALWDLDARQAGRRVWAIAGLPIPAPVITAYTLSLAEPAAMQAAARQHRHRPLLKIKLDAEHIVARVTAVRQAAPAAQLIVDANEAWTIDLLSAVSPELAALGIALVEQPLPAGADAVLEQFTSPVPLGADESCHTAAGIDQLAARYQIINIKLDKTGGLTEALRLRQAALAHGIGFMVGCMVGTSLAMAPAVLLTAGARFVDLDGPLLLAEDRSPGLDYTAHCVHPAKAELWG